MLVFREQKCIMQTRQTAQIQENTLVQELTEKLIQENSGAGHCGCHTGILWKHERRKVANRNAQDVTVPNHSFESVAQQP